MPKVSVVVPTYNNAQYIRQALDSVFDQTFTDYEIIVVDDGSTDETHRELESYGRRIRYHRQDNGGLAVARNTGMRLANGDLLTYLDADDVWERDNLLFKTSLLERHSDLGGVFSEFSIFDDRQTRHERGSRQMFPFFERTGRDLRHVLGTPRSAIVRDGRTVLARTGFAFDSLFWGNFILPTSMILRLEAARAVGDFEPELRTQQDYEYWLRFSKRYPLAYIDEPLVRYRRHPGQLTDHRRIENILVAVDRIIRQYDDEFEHAGRGDEYRRRLAGVKLELAKVCLGQGRSGDARSHLVQCIKLAPGTLAAYLALFASLLPSGWLSAVRRWK